MNNSKVSKVEIKKIGLVEFIAHECFFYTSQPVNILNQPSSNIKTIN